jgi:hypothetical protein
MSHRNPRAATKIAAAALLALALASTACGSLRGAAVAPDEHAGPLPHSVIDTSDTGMSQGAYIMADDRYGVTIKPASSSHGRAGDVPVCAEMGTPCIAP